jgi:hypothetical protein
MMHTRRRVPNSLTRLVAPFLVATTMSFAIASCASVLETSKSAAPPGSRVYHDPYRQVNWGTDLALKTQTHDHAGTSTTKIAAYDAAGYDVIGLSDYSGVASLSYSWTARRWPPDAYLTKSFMTGLKHIKTFIPDAEDVEFLHLESPFLTTYIAKWEPALYPTRQPWHCASTQECIDLIATYGGLPIVAHPWSNWRDYESLKGYFGVEVYNAYGTYQHEFGTDTSLTNTDPNATILTRWDQMLAKNPYVIGLAVNDHYGPDNTEASVPARIRDSGKIILLARDLTLDALRDAFQRGALFGIKDVGTIKDRYPTVLSVLTTDSTITISTDGSVAWVVNGARVAGTSNTLNVRGLSTGYARATVTNVDGSTVFIQPFVLRAIGDANGDGVVDAADVSICNAVAAKVDTDVDHVASCLRR